MVRCVEWLVFLVELYAIAGLCFAASFASFGVQRIDAAARQSGVAFRLIILPGAAALWPLLLARWVRAWRAK